jgi:DNA-binding MarR family transcriptional regulator
MTTFSPPDQVADPVADPATDQASNDAPMFTPPATRVLRQFRVVFNAVKTHFRQIEKSAGIGGAQVWALSVIQTTPGICLNGLAEAMDVHQSTISNLVKGLIARDLITTKRDEDDRRAVRLFLADAGRTILDKAPGPFSGVLPTALNKLDIDTLICMEQDLRQLIEVLQADEAGAAIPLADL